MTDLSKIQPTQRIHPAIQDLHVKQRTKNKEREKKNRQAEKEDDKDRKVDEYI